MRNIPETTIEAFEARMALRRKMFRRTGVQMPRSNGTPDQENLIKQSVVRCVACQAADACAVWLDAAHPDAAPPAFCPNADMLQDLKRAKPVR
ncbi:MAG: DUF6455 family protein [Pseudomonadota bacterium]